MSACINDDVPHSRAPGYFCFSCLALEHGPWTVGVVTKGCSGVQARHDEESALQTKRQTNFQRDRDQLAKDAEREYEQACEKSTFKIQILDKRLKRNEEQALRKYYELDFRLRSDPRLAVLLEPA
jgi:hypothetical protein